jgi:outer membrane protein OmpA-like peptidoglycan-associated protein
MRTTTLLAVVFAAACSGHAQTQISTTPSEPAPPAAAPEPADEPEAPPVVKEEPKSLDIQKDVIRLKPGIKILFATNSDQLMPESNEILDEVASVLQQNERLHIRVEGHTDNTGDKAHNDTLSTQRAASVKAYLVAKGIPDDRLDSLGCGQGTPVADNATEDGRQQNRRVEFVIVRKRHPRGNCELYKPGEHHHHHGEGAGSAAGSGATP